MTVSVHFPQQMTEADRWMVRIEPDGSKESKQPLSINESEPEGYFGLRWCRSRWGHPTQWATFDDALTYALENGPKEDEPPKPGEVTHLCFVLRDITQGEDHRFIAFDFDGCIDEHDNLDPAVCEVLSELDTWVEVSKNGRGLHAVGRYYGPAIKTQTKCPIGNCTVDVITSGQIVCTGQQYGDYSKWNDKPKTRTAKDSETDAFEIETPDLPIGKFEYFREVMETWEPCIEGQDGDGTFFKAALYLGRFGSITGDDAVTLLGHVQQHPPFNLTETQWKVQCAYEELIEEGQFGLYDAAANFGSIEPVEVDEIVVVRYGYEGNSLLQHFEAFSPDTRPNYIIDEVLFEQGSMIIGGQQKSFKTSIGLDLLVSLATLKPFLNKFPIECDPKSIAIFSAETTEWMMTDYLRTILASKSLHPADVKSEFTINSNVPAFVMDRSGEMKRNKAFEKYMERHRPNVVFLDPMYRMFAGVNQADISQVGRALDYVEQICKEYDSMPIFCHHSRKPNTQNGVEFPKMTLNDLSGAGGGAFARQWILLS
ncbi:MAG: AAA family ATPase, partial [Planctomycetota bacterium]